MNIILRIAIPVPLRQLFDYLPPIEPHAVKLEPGMRVLVPFGRRKTVGIIVEVTDHTDHPIEKLKRIQACLDKEPPDFRKYNLLVAELKLICFC